MAHTGAAPYPRRFECAPGTCIGDPARLSGTWVAHAYDDNGTYDIAATIVDNDGGKGSATLAQQVANVAPTVELTVIKRHSNAWYVDVSGDVHDPSSVDTFQIGLQWVGETRWYKLLPGKQAGDPWGFQKRLSDPDWSPEGSTVVITDDDGGSTTLTVPAATRR